MHFILQRSLLTFHYFCLLMDVISLLLKSLLTFHYFGLLIPHPSRFDFCTSHFNANCKHHSNQTTLPYSPLYAHLKTDGASHALGTHRAAPFNYYILLRYCTPRMSVLGNELVVAQRGELTQAGRAAFIDYLICMYNALAILWNTTESTNQHIMTLLTMNTATRTCVHCFLIAGDLPCPTAQCLCPGSLLPLVLAINQVHGKLRVHEAAAMRCLEFSSVGPLSPHVTVCRLVNLRRLQHADITASLHHYLLTSVRLFACLRNRFVDNTL